MGIPPRTKNATTATDIAINGAAQSNAIEEMNILLIPAGLSSTGSASPGTHRSSAKTAAPSEIRMVAGRITNQPIIGRPVASSITKALRMNVQDVWAMLSGCVDDCVRLFSVRYAPYARNIPSMTKNIEQAMGHTILMEISNRKRRAGSNTTVVTPPSQRQIASSERKDLLAVILGWEVLIPAGCVARCVIPAASPAAPIPAMAKTTERRKHPAILVSSRGRTSKVTTGGSSINAARQPTKKHCQGVRSTRSRARTTPAGERYLQAISTPGNMISSASSAPSSTSNSPIYI